MIEKALVFTTPTCINCKRIISFLETKDFPKEIIDATSAEGMVLAKDNNVFSVPTVLLYTTGGKVHIARDIEDIETLL